VGERERERERARERERERWGACGGGFLARFDVIISTTYQRGSLIMLMVGAHAVKPSWVASIFENARISLPITLPTPWTRELLKLAARLRASGKDVAQVSWWQPEVPWIVFVPQ
jgi:hypothetical protein